MSEVVDEADGGRLFQRVVDVVDVHLALVEEVVEDVDRLHGRRALLLVAEDQVDPLVEVGRHVVALKSLGEGGEAGQRSEPAQSNRNPIQSEASQSLQPPSADLSVDPDELAGVALGPGRQDHVAQLGAVLLCTWNIKQ